MDPRVDPLRTQLRLNSRLFVNCFEGVDDGLAQRRVSAVGFAVEANPMAFLGVHLVDSRHILARLLGKTLDKPFPQYDSVRHASQIAEYPAVSDILDAWHQLAGALDGLLPELTDDVLGGKAPYDFPVQADDATMLGGLAFLLQHEAYHLGQLALLRKLLGLPAMSYA